MGDLWLPESTRVAAVRSGDVPRRADAPARGVVHTLETPTGTGLRVLSTMEWPYQVVADPVLRQAWQAIPFNRTAYALKGVAGRETNHMGRCCAQIALVGYARDMHRLTDDQLDWLATTVFGPASWLCGIPMAPHPTFWGEGAGFVLATTTSKARLTWAQWESLNGWIGHQHAPGQDHWDPGALNWPRIAATATAPEPQEQPVEPIGSADLIEPTGPGHIRLAGWAGRPDGQPIAVTFWVDGTQVAAITPDLPRGDVTAAHPGIVGTPGFDRTITATPGAHTVKIVASAAGKVATIGEQTVAVPSPTTQPGIDVEAVHDELAKASAAIAAASRLLGR